MNDLVPPARRRTDVHRSMADRAAASGIRRVHLLAWRDLDDPTAGGSEVYVLHLSQDLAAAGLEVTIRTAQVGDRPDEVRRGPVRVVRRGGRASVFASTMRDERTGRLGPADGIVEVFHGFPYFAPLWSPRTPMVSIVHHVLRGTWRHLLPAPAAAAGYLVERFAIPLVYGRREIVTIAESTREVLLRAYRADPERVSVAPCGVSPRFSPGGERAEDPLVVAVARLVPAKALPDLLSAFELVHRTVPDARLVVVGDGPERPAVEAEIARRNLAGAVDCVGRADDDELVAWYRRAWVVASASLREGFGLTLTEAGACGTPAVARRISGHTDAVIDGTTGLLADDPVEMAAHLVTLIEDEDLRRTMGTAARVHAAGFTWERAAELVLEALCRDADRRR